MMIVFRRRVPELSETDGIKTQNACSSVVGFFFFSVDINYQSLSLCRGV